MRPDEVQLQRAQILGADSHVAELSESGVDAVHRGVAGEDALDDRARRRHALEHTIRDRDPRSLRDGAYVLEGQ
jgi:hypothetical protein